MAIAFPFNQKTVLKTTNQTKLSESNFEKKRASFIIQ